MHFECVPRKEVVAERKLLVFLLFLVSFLSLMFISMFFTAFEMYSCSIRKFYEGWVGLGGLLRKF